MTSVEKYSDVTCENEEEQRECRSQIYHRTQEASYILEAGVISVSRKSEMGGAAEGVAYEVECGSESGSKEGSDTEWE